MMYGASDAAAHLGPPSGWPQGPGDGVRFQGLERRRRRRVERRLVPRLRAGRAALCADRLRGVLRLPGQPPVASASTRTASARSSGRPSRCSRPPRRARRAIWCSCRESSRRCAGGRSARTSSTSPRRSACSSSSRSARCSATCRTRARWRSPGTRPTRRWLERAGMQSLQLRGPDGDRRRAAQRLRAGGAAVGEPVGMRAALRGRRDQPEGGAGARAPRRRRWSASRSTCQSSSPPRPTTSARSDSPCRATRTSRSSSNASSRPPRATAEGSPENVPSGDMLAREFQRFLRQRGQAT